MKKFPAAASALPLNVFTCTTTNYSGRVQCSKTWYNYNLTAVPTCHTCSNTFLGIFLTRRHLVNNFKSYNFCISWLQKLILNYKNTYILISLISILFSIRLRVSSSLKWCKNIPSVRVSWELVQQNVSRKEAGAAANSPQSFSFFSIISLYEKFLLWSGED